MPAFITFRTPAQAVPRDSTLLGCECPSKAGVLTTLQQGLFPLLLSLPGSPTTPASGYPFFAGKHSLYCFEGSSRKFPRGLLCVSYVAWLHLRVVSESVDDLASANFVLRLLSAELHTKYTILGCSVKDGCGREPASGVNSGKYDIVSQVCLGRMCKLRVYSDVLHANAVCLSRKYVAYKLEIDRAAFPNPVVGVRNYAFACTGESIGESELVGFGESQQHSAVIVQLITPVCSS